MAYILLLIPSIFFCQGARERKQRSLLGKICRKQKQRQQFGSWRYCFWLYTISHVCIISNVSMLWLQTYMFCPLYYRWSLKRRGHHRWIEFWANYVLLKRKHKACALQFLSARISVLSVKISVLWGQPRRHPWEGLASLSAAVSPTMLASSDMVGIYIDCRNFLVSYYFACPTYLDLC